MITKGEVVLRELLVAAAAGRTRWTGFDELSRVTSVARTTVFQALARAVRIGAVPKRARGGFSVVAPQKLKVLLCAARSPERDLIGYLDSDEVAQYRSSLILSGPDAVTELIGGLNTIGSLGVRTMYATGSLPALHQNGHEHAVRVLQPDPRLIELTQETGIASIPTVQTDLFATPGWQAAEFAHALEAWTSRPPEGEDVADAV